MRTVEYALSVLVALLVLAGLVAWTQASGSLETMAVACRSGKPAPALSLKGLAVLPRCPVAKPG
jgi:hypothetical protein